MTSLLSNSTLHISWNSDLQWSLGPSIDCLVSWEELSEDFRDLEILHAKEKEAIFSEGKFHRSRTVLTEFVARKPVATRSVTDLRSDAFCSAIETSQRDTFQLGRISSLALNITKNIHKERIWLAAICPTSRDNIFL